MIDNFITRRLSRKLLIMTIGFVMVAETLIFIPSAAVFRQQWLDDRAQRAGHLALALTGVPDYEGSEILSEQFMKDTDVSMLLAKRKGMSVLILGSPPKGAKFEEVDLRQESRLPPFMDTFRSFFGSTEGYLRVKSHSLVEGHEHIEYIVPKAALHEALRGYCHRILLLSFIIAIITGMLLFAALSAMIVRPVRRLANGLIDFRDDPETRRSNRPSARRQDEIGQLEREFFDMKQSVRGALKQQDRLAALGLAVAKINHDLRNVLTSAQLVSDRIAMDKDERVSYMGQRLVRAVDRGVKLCEDVLSFSQSRKDPPQLAPTRISLLAGEAAADTLGSFGSEPKAINFKNSIPSELSLNVDPDHTYRILNNLFRNAAQAMAGMRDDAAMRELTVTSYIKDGIVSLDITDTGPGIPAKAQDNLFKAFAASSGHGSTGLGLTIARELAQDQGGHLNLKHTGKDGTTFTVHFAPGVLDS